MDIPSPLSKKDQRKARSHIRKKQVTSSDIPVPQTPTATQATTSTGVPPSTVSSTYPQIKPTPTATLIQPQASTSTVIPVNMASADDPAATMSDDAARTLWCLIRDDSTPFEATASGSDSINRLKERILEKGVYPGSAILAKDLKLWKLKTPEPVDPDDTLTDRISAQLEDLSKSAEPLSVGKDVSEFFPKPSKAHLHVIVEIKPSPPRKRELDSDSEAERGKRRKDAVPDDRPFEDTPKKSRNEIQIEISEYVEKYRNNMWRIAKDAGNVPLLIASWAPAESCGDKTFSDHISKLAIPSVNDAPSLLLHDLGEERADLDKEHAKRIANVFTFSKHIVLINTSGSGKTRLLLDGLCRHWGFYFVGMQDTDGIGSCDFWSAMELDESRDYKRAKSLKMKNQDAMDHMKAKAHQRLLQLLLARFILLELFVEEAKKVPGGLHPKNHRRAWVLLQVQPWRIFGEDIFDTLTRALRCQFAVDLTNEIKERYQHIRAILNQVRNPATGNLETPPLYCVVDESQLLTSERTGEFWSEDSRKGRPLMRQVYLSYTNIMPGGIILVCSGTGMNYQLFEETLTSGIFKSRKYRIEHDTGAFEDRDAQAEYIQYYLGYNRTGPAWKAFLKRAWGWCRGRYRSTAALIFWILVRGYQSPHAILDRYVEAFTKFTPTDGQTWVGHEPVVRSDFRIDVSPMPFDRMNEREMSTLRTVVYSQILCGVYSLGAFASAERQKFVELAFARHKSGGDTVIDEPLPILAAVNWLNSRAQFSLDDFLRQDVGKHAPRKNGFEVYLAFYLRKIFEATPKLDEVFTFRDDFARMQHLSWQHEEFRLVTVTNTSTPQISVATPSSGPSSNIGLIADNDQVVEWLSTNEHQFIFCFPPEAFGPDLLFFLQHQRTGRLLLVMVQAKNYSNVDATSLITGVRTVTPAWLWKTKNKNYSSPHDAPYIAENEGSRLFHSTQEALANLPLGLRISNTLYPILRVFASWPGDAGLVRTMTYEEPTTQNMKKKEQDDDPERIPDPDLHPLATLHLTNFQMNGVRLDKNWFLGDVEQREVIHAPNPAMEGGELRRSQRIKAFALEHAGKPQ